MIEKLKVRPNKHHLFSLWVCVDCGQIKQSVQVISTFIQACDQQQL